MPVHRALWNAATFFMASRRSSAEVMLYRANTVALLCPLTSWATFWETPLRTRLRTAVRRRSWNSRSGTPAALVAVAQARTNARRRTPSRLPRPCAQHDQDGGGGDRITEDGERLLGLPHGERPPLLVRVSR
jgi:hypothetical protein